MDIKILEVRDRATFVPVMAIDMIGSTEQERYYLQSSGFPIDPALITVVRLEGLEAHYDPFAWKSPWERTLREAHLYIQDHFYELHTGDVVDVEFILGETDKPKTSERFC